MNYLIFIRKSPWGNPIIGTVMSFFNRRVFNNSVCLSRPGYLSTTTSTADDFCNRVNFPQNTIFEPGMGDNSLIKGDPRHRTKREYHNDKYLRINRPSGVPHSNVDHAKNLFYFTGVDEFILDENNYLQILRDHGPSAILIGSSNQSFRTYFTSQYGESDVLIINSERYPGQNFQELFNSLIQILGDDSSNVLFCTQMDFGNGGSDYLMSNVFNDYCREQAEEQQNRELALAAVL